MAINHSDFSPAGLNRAQRFKLSELVGNSCAADAQSFRNLLVRKPKLVQASAVVQK
jgi:hypothetical protein